MVETKEFIEQLISIARKSLEPSTQRMKYVPCNTYSDDDYLQYIRGTMLLEKIRLFEEHCENCPACLRGLLKNYEKFLQEREKFENEALFRKTLNLLGVLDAQGKGNILEVIITTFKEVVKVLTTTGEILRATQLVPARGQDNRTKRKQPVQILKEFDEPPMSVQVSFQAGKPEELDLNISLFNRQNDEFMSGIPIVLTGAGMEETKISNENGEAIFVLKGHGMYRATLGSDERPIGRLNVSVTKE